MVAQTFIVVVEDVDAARSALRWAVRNLLRHGDLITLIHVLPSSRSRNGQKQRRRRSNGFQLALSFKELCVGVPEAKVEIIVTEGDQEATIVSLVREIGASTLVIGIHDKSFLFKSDTALNWINDLNCRVFAVKQPTAGFDNSAKTELSQIEIVRPRWGPPDGWPECVTTLLPNPTSSNFQCPTGEKPLSQLSVEINKKKEKDMKEGGAISLD